MSVYRFLYKLRRPKFKSGILVDCTFNFYFQITAVHSLCTLNNPTKYTKTQAYPPHNCTYRATLDIRHLTSQSNSVSKQSVGISVVDVLLGSQATEEVVSVTTKVRGALDLVEMGHLV
jgi:NMD protein affecting ribosome stability and mRNA decay